MNTHNYEKLIVWQKAMDLVEEIYHLTDTFPKTEAHGLTSHIRRSAVSIPSNIADGCRRGTSPYLRQFLSMAAGSGGELETQIKIAKRVGYLNRNSEKAEGLLEEVMKMTYKLSTLK